MDQRSFDETNWEKIASGVSFDLDSAKQELEDLAKNTPAQDEEKLLEDIDFAQSELIEIFKTISFNLKESDFPANEQAKTYVEFLKQLPEIVDMLSQVESEDF